jgi:MFS family permease
MKSTKNTTSLTGHPLVHLLVRSKGNPKVLLLIEPLWGIPFHLLAPFIALFMSLQGITDTQIGILLSVTMVGQMVFSFLGGIITDKFGRKNTTVFADIFGWGIACFIWAISTNFWFFLVAILFNTIDRVSMSSWHCLLVEDADQNDMLGIYTWVTIGGLVAVFFAPIAGILIFNFTLIPVVRGLYIFFSINLIIKGIITYFHCTETKQGKVRREETKPISSVTLALEYKSLIPRILKNPGTVKIMIINVILHITILTTNTFFGLYVTDKLGVPDEYLAFFPIINAIIMLLFIFVIQHKLEFIRNKIPLWAGLLIFAFCSVMLILIPQGNLLLIIVYLLLIAVANGLVLPRRDAMTQLAIDPQERSRIMSLLATLTVAFAAPFGFLAGYLSDIDRRLPFLMTTVFFIIALVVVGLMKDDEYKAGSR